MTAADRIALVLGRAILRAETLEAELEAAKMRMLELEQTMNQRLSSEETD